MALHFKIKDIYNDVCLFFSTKHIYFILEGWCTLTHSKGDTKMRIYDIRENLSKKLWKITFNFSNWFSNQISLSHSDRIQIEI